MVADILYPMPPSLFTTLSVRYGWSVHQAPSTGLYTVGLTDIGGYYGDQILVKWSLNPKMDIGVDIGLGARYVQKTLGSSRVESQEISYRYIHAYVDYLLVKDLNFELRGFVGAKTWMAYSTKSSTPKQVATIYIIAERELCLAIVMG